jgi:hypothetical protein
MVFFTYPFEFNDKSRTDPYFFSLKKRQIYGISHIGISFQFRKLSDGSKKLLLSPPQLSDGSQKLLPSPYLSGRG